MNDTDTLRDLVLTSGLSATDVDRRLRRAARLADVGNRAVAFYLAELDERGLYQALGAPTVVAYATRALGISRRRARELAMVGRRLRELPVVDAAFAEGAVSWSKVRRLCAVATAGTESEWLAHAQRSSQDELERAVRAARRGDRPSQRTGLPRARFTVRVDLDALQQQVWENAREKLRAEFGWDAEVEDSDLIVEMARLVLATDADGSVPGRRPVDGSIYKVVVRDGAAGDAGPQSGPQSGPRSGPESGPRSGAEVLTDDGAEPIDDSAAEVATEDVALSPKLRARVLARDGHRCRHCGGRRPLHVHHVTWRRHGGKTALPNLVTLCAKCHGLVHDGLLEVDTARCVPGEAGSGAAGETGRCTSAEASPPRSSETAPPGSSETAPRALSGRGTRGTGGAAKSGSLAPAPFVFRDAGGARLDGWPLRGPRIRIEPANVASTEVAHGAAPDDRVAALDGRWLRDHLHWFADGRRGLVVKPEYRVAFERLIDVRDAG